MDDNIRYIETNYIEQAELCKRSNISSEELLSLIDMELVPAASYTIKSVHEISSPLGDAMVVTKMKNYFPQSTVNLIHRNRSVKNSNAFKASVKSEFVQTLVNSEDKHYAYGNILDEDGMLDQVKVDAAFEEEWQYYCQGIYGICTLHASGVEIAKKEIAVKKLIEFNELHKESILNDAEREKLKELDAEFNSVSNVFAPYQREMSSRGKYLDKILGLNGLEARIKRYNE